MSTHDDRLHRRETTENRTPKRRRVFLNPKHIRLILFTASEDGTVQDERLQHIHTHTHTHI